MGGLATYLVEARELAGSRGEALCMGEEVGEVADSSRRGLSSAGKLDFVELWA